MEDQVRVELADDEEVVGPHRSGHVLVCGGTGILAPAVRTLARRGATVGVLARRPERAPAGYPIAADARDGPALVRALDAAIAAHGPFDLVLAYEPASAPSVAARAAGTLVHVLPSRWAAPGMTRAQREAGAPPGPGTTRWVLLGWVREGRESRWHTPGEISAAVLRAAKAGASEEIVVGELAPWEARPG